jgi:hypothetical protein
MAFLYRGDCVAALSTLLDATPPCICKHCLTIIV